MISLINLVFANDLPGLRSALASGVDPDERDNEQRTPLIHASIDNRLEAARLLLEAGAQVDARDRPGNAPLHYAAQEYHLEMANLLLNQGKAQVDIMDSHGNTPLWRAVFNSRGRGEMISLLLRAGADRDHRNARGKSPLDLANGIANYQVAGFLREEASGR